MATLTLPGLDDDREHKRRKRSRQRTDRHVEDLDTLDVPERSCQTCRHWWPVDEAWGECRETLVTSERVNAELYPPRGIEKGTVVARWPAPHPTPFRCVDSAWDAARAAGQPRPFRTHRTYLACDRYERGEADQVQQDRPRLVDRVKGVAA